MGYAKNQPADVTLSRSVLF